MAKEPRHKRLYKDSPKLERGDDGHMGVTKKGDKPNEAEKVADDVQSGMDDVKVTEGMPANVRHASERMDMHKRHEMEHAVHDHAKAGHKEELHSRHEKEMKAMHSRHEKEVGDGEGKDQDIKPATKAETKGE